MAVALVIRAVVTWRPQLCRQVLLLSAFPPHGTRSLCDRKHVWVLIPGRPGVMSLPPPSCQLPVEDARYSHFSDKPQVQPLTLDSKDTQLVAADDPQVGNHIPFSLPLRPCPGVWGFFFPLTCKSECLPRGRPPVLSPRPRVHPRASSLHRSPGPQRSPHTYTSLCKVGGTTPEQMLGQCHVGPDRQLNPSSVSRGYWSLDRGMCRGCGCRASATAGGNPGAKPGRGVQASLMFALVFPTFSVNGSSVKGAQEEVVHPGWSGGPMLRLTDAPEPRA